MPRCGFSDVTCATGNVLRYSCIFSEILWSLQARTWWNPDVFSLGSEPPWGPGPNLFPQPNVMPGTHLILLEMFCGISCKGKVITPQSFWKPYTKESFYKNVVCNEPALLEETHLLLTCDCREMQLVLIISPLPLGSCILLLLWHPLLGSWIKYPLLKAFLFLSHALIFSFLTDLLCVWGGTGLSISCQALAVWPDQRVTGRVRERRNK